MNYPLISIIVPVYQVEKYLEKCINSIINQTYKNLEIILVDDGSTDNCPSICNHFQTEDTRIKVIHQENGGLSHARNVGLEISTGDFFGFVDSDDWIEPNMYEVLMSALQETDADIVVCNHLEETDDSIPIPITSNSLEKKLYLPKETLKKIISGENLTLYYVWNKLYKKSILSNIRFPTNKIHEDILWSPQIIGNSRLILSINRPLYHYIIRPGSLTRNKSIAIKRILDKNELLIRQIMYIREQYPALEKVSIINFQNTCLREYNNISINFNHLDPDGKIRHELHHQFCQYGLNNIIKYDGIKTTIARVLFRFCPSLLVKIYAIYKRIAIDD